MMPFLAAIAAFVCIAALGFSLNARLTVARTALDQRLGRAQGAGRATRASLTGAIALRSSRFGRSEGVARALAGIRAMRSLSTMLERAAWSMSVTEFLMVCGTTCMLGGCIAFLLMRALLLPVALVAALLPVLFLRMAVQRRRKRFAAQLVEALTLLANSLKAGVSLLQAIDKAADQLSAPISDEFRRALHDIRIGSSPDDAFNALNERVGSDDLDIVITAIIVQRSTGGNLAEILENVAKTMRERIRIRGEIKTLTTQQQYSGYLIGFMPVALLILFNFINHAYILPLFTTTVGHLMLGGAGVMQLIGFFLIRKIVNIEV